MNSNEIQRNVYLSPIYTTPTRILFDAANERLTVTHSVVHSREFVKNLKKCR